MCSIASSTESTTPHREDHRQELGRPVLLGRLGERAGPSSPASARARSSTRSSTPASRSARSARGRNAGAASACTSSVSAALQTPGPLRLGVHDDRLRRVEVGGRVDVDVAVARRGVDHGHGGDRAQRGLQPLPAARDDQVDDAVLGGELGQLLAAAAGHERERALGQPGALGRLGRDAREHGVRVRRGRGAAQHDRVARLQAQRGGVDRHVGPRLVDHRDDAERDAHLADVEPVGQAEARRSPRRPGRAARRSRARRRPSPRRAPRRGAAGRAAPRPGPPRGRPPCRARWPRGSPAVRASSARRSRPARRPWCRCRARASARAARGGGAGVGDGGGASWRPCEKVTPARSSPGGPPPRSRAAAARAPARTSGP